MHQRPSNILRWSCKVSPLLICLSFPLLTQYSAGRIFRLYVEAMAMQYAPAHQQQQQNEPSLQQQHRQHSLQ